MGEPGTSLWMSSFRKMQRISYIHVASYVHNIGVGTGALGARHAFPPPPPPPIFDLPVDTNSIHGVAQNNMQVTQERCQLNKYPANVQKKILEH